MIKFFCLIFISQALNAQNFTFSLEKSKIGIKAKPKYDTVSSVIINSNNVKHNYRIKITARNDTKKDITAIILRYSFKLTLKKHEKIIQTISLYSSGLRISEIKAGKEKVVFIYELKNVFDQLKRFLESGYEPLDLVVDIMKEPKRNEDFVSYSVAFPLKVD
ncbi:MAG: hypothetical protein K6357_06095 [Elusimicrobiota bacterium]